MYDHDYVINTIKMFAIPRDVSIDFTSQSFGLNYKFKQ